MWRFNHRVIASDDGMIGGDITDAAHVGGETVDFIDIARDGETSSRAAEVKELEIVSSGGLIVRRLQVYSAVTAPGQAADKLMADETTGIGDENGGFMTLLKNGI